MLSLDDIQNQCKTAESTVQIDAWDGEVKIRQLTVAESANVISTQNRGDQATAMVMTASFALVEPKASVKKLQGLSQEAFEGIKEIVEAVGDLGEPKK